MAVIKRFQKKEEFTATIIIMTVLFFMWGLISNLNEQLVPLMKNICHTKGIQNSLLDLSFFGAYFFMSVPAVYVSKFLGIKKGIILGICLCALGATLFYPAAEYALFSLFLLAIFLLATGITFLQLLANPYLTLLGEASNASARLNLSQAFNSLGASFAPYITGFLIVGGVSNVAKESVAKQTAIVQPLYLITAFLLIVLAVVFLFVFFPKAYVFSGKQNKTVQFPSTKEYRIWAGALAIFLYVGVEVTVARFIGGTRLGTMKADQVLYYYWFLMMLGRFVGSFFLLRVSPSFTLLIVAVLNVLLAIGLCFFPLSKGVYFLMMIGLFNAIMFPTIFSLSVERLKRNMLEGSALLMMAIVGGAIVPFFTGSLPLLGFVLTIALCYIGIVIFAFLCFKRKL